MAQTSGVGHDEAWGWPCPYCRAQNSVDAAACAHCGAQLRDPDDDDLFTTVAADNAEVVPPDAPFGRENMWTTDANRDDDDDDDVDEGEFVEDDTWMGSDANGTNGARPVFGGSFTSEPASRPEDVIDEPFHVDEPTAPTANGTPRATGNLFSSTSTGRPAPDPAGVPGTPRSPFGVPGPEPAHQPRTPPVDTDPWAPQDRWGTAAPGWTQPQGPNPWAAPPYGQQPPPSAPMGPPPGYDQHHAPQHHQQPQQQWAPPQQGPPGGYQDQHYGEANHEPYHAPVPDPHGLSAAVGRLRPEDQERAAIPIAVCGALLQHDEVVLAAVTGQMLGHAAVVVLTTRRVMVVNGRRWQPIVDVFEVGPSLTVRGRHDRDVAALTFSDETRLSTVDGIAEVGLAVELAERIKGE